MFIVCGVSRNAPRQGCNVSIHKTRAVESNAFEKTTLHPYGVRNCQTLLLYKHCTPNGVRSCCAPRSITMKSDGAGRR